MKYPETTKSEKKKRKDLQDMIQRGVKMKQKKQTRIAEKKELREKSSNRREKKENKRLE